MGELSRKLKPMESLFALFVAFAFAVDIPAAKAYNDHQAFTEIFGRYLFHGLKELWNLPIPFTLFELLSYGMVMLMLCAYGWQRARYWNNLMIIGLIVPLACAFAVLSGALRGNSLGLAMTQLHFVPMLSAWLAIGYFVGTRPQLQGRLIRILFAVCIWRSIYALYVYFFVYKGSMQDYEYLIDHTASIFLATGMAYGLIQMWFHRQHKTRVAFYTLSVGLMTFTFLLNDRRASFAGLTAALLLLPWILSDRLRSALLRPYKLALLVGPLLLVYLAVRSNDPYSFIGALKTETVGAESLTYRHIENYNLMIGLIRQPLLGMGFGARFPQAIELPDISFAFELFDAIPHNTVYFLWTFGGPLGIASLMTLSCGLLCVITRVGRGARYKSELLLAAIGLVVTCQWLMYVLFDMGLLESRCLMMMGLFTGSLFPLYARLLWEHRHAKNLVQKSQLLPALPQPERSLQQV